MNNLNIIEDLEDDLDSVKVNPYKIELHANIALNNTKKIDNLLKNISSDFLFTLDSLGLNTIDFTRKYGTKETYYKVITKIIKDRGGFIDCYKNLKQRLY